MTSLQAKFRRRGLGLLVAVTCAVLASCASVRAPPVAQMGAPSAVSDAAKPRTAGLAHHLDDLTVSQARVIAGEHVIYSYRGQTPPPSLIAAIRAGEAAGVILFTPNVVNPMALRAGVTEMQAAAHLSPQRARLLIMVDQEGGLVRRLPGAPTVSEKQIGASRDATRLARQAGKGAAGTLKAAGINVNLAPVLDVFRTAKDFIDQFQRSYSDDPDLVATLGADFVAAQQRAGVAATAKHFPGLGSAGRTQDTDQTPVRLSLGVAQLRRVDEEPYRAVIAAGVKLIMVSWATYPALDSSRPAGLSSKVIEGELRRRLHFSGVTITDSIEAGALRHEGAVARRSVLATAAGADLILACGADHAENSPQIGMDATRAIASALLRHRLSLPALQRSTARVMALRSAP